MFGKYLLPLFLIVSFSALIVFCLRRTSEVGDKLPQPLTEEQIDSMYPCVYYSGQSSSADKIMLLGQHSDLIMLARIERFELADFDSPDISWSAIFRVSKYITGSGEDVCCLPIQSPERNFGSIGEGRLFIIFIRKKLNEPIWTLEPWFPEIEDILAYK